MRWFLMLVVLLTGCRTTTKSAPPPAPQWEVPFTLVDGLPVVERNGARLVFDTSATQSSALVLARSGLPPANAMVIDFPRGRIIGLQGMQTAWLRWLDERSPNGALESLARKAEMTIAAKVGDAGEHALIIATAEKRTHLPASLFDTTLISGGQVKGLHLALGETKLGAFDVDASSEAPGKLGMDVLQDAVLLIPNNANVGVWFLKP